MSESCLSEIRNNTHDENECLLLLCCGKSDATRKQATNIPRAVTIVSPVPSLQVSGVHLAWMHGPQSLRNVYFAMENLLLLLLQPWSSLLFSSPSAPLHVPSSSLFCFLPFLKYTFPEALPSWLRGSAVPCGGSSGASWSQLEPVVSGLGQPQPLLTEAPAAPHCQCLGTRTRYSIIQSEPNSSVTTRPTLSRAADSS